MIYFAQPTDGGPVKIGCSDDVDARLRQLEGCYGKPLALLATLPGGYATESEIHQRFAHLRLGRTEQFRPAPELMEFIGRPIFVSPNPGAVEVMASRNNVLSIRGSIEWRDWLNELSDHCRLKSADVIDRALIVYAKQEGFTKSPPKR